MSFVVTAPFSFQTLTGKLPTRSSVPNVTLVGEAADVRFVSATLPATTVPAQFAPSAKYSAVSTSPSAFATLMDPVAVFAPFTIVTVNG